MKRYLNILISISACLAALGCGKKLGPADIVFQNPSQAVADARQLIQNKQENPKLYTDWLFQKDLPESLHCANFKCAVVHKDHMDLLIAKIPDWWVGARIWSTNSTQTHSDKNTMYPDIYFFTYSNDFPDSPENIR